MNKLYRITLLFNANKVYDRQVIEGIGEYIQASQCEWDIFLEEEFTTNLDKFKLWRGDGIIADFDDPDIVKIAQSKDLPIVGVGGSYQNSADYPQVPYVATDNHKLIEMALTHLKEKGLENFAFYSLPNNPYQRWANERENAFKQITQQQGYNASIYHGNTITPDTWQYDMNRLADWIQRLPTPVGIIAVTDSRARHLLQVCEHLNIIVPDKVSIIGIDNEDLARYLTRVSLSSVGQGCKTMGYLAAKMLHKRLQQYEHNDRPFKETNPPRILVPPTEIYARQSTDFQALKDPYVIQAMHYIRHNACKGIKVEQVLEYVGLSRSNMEARYKEERGLTIHQEIHNYKFKQAENLLKTTSISIQEISEMCGYPALQYMYAIFKKTINMTPKEYRLKHKTIKIQ
jgi:LacI family transcriptional regulator